MDDGAVERRYQIIKMKKLFFIIFFIFSLAALAQQKKVAVYVSSEDEGIKKILGSKLVAALARSEDYTAIERTAAFLAELKKEQNYQRTGAVDNNDISRLGKQFGVQYVCVADVTDVYGEKYISARLIDVETAEVIDASDGGGRISSRSDCERIANDIAIGIVGKLSPDGKAFAQVQYNSLISSSTISENNASKFGNCNLTEIYSAYIQKRYNGRDISEDESAKNYMQEQVKQVVESVTLEYGLIGIFDDAAILYKGRDAKDITGLVMSKLNL